MVGSIFFLWCLLKLCYLRLKIMWGRTSFKLTKKLWNNGWVRYKVNWSKMKFFIKESSSEFEQICNYLRICYQLTKEIYYGNLQNNNACCFKTTLFFQAAFVAQWILYLLNLNEFCLQSKDFVVVTKIKNDFFKLSI